MDLICAKYDERTCLIWGKYEVYLHQKGWYLIFGKLQCCEARQKWKVKRDIPRCESTKRDNSWSSWHRGRRREVPSPIVFQYKKGRDPALFSVWLVELDSVEMKKGCSFFGKGDLIKV